MPVIFHVLPDDLDACGREAAGANMEADASDNEQTERYSNQHKIPACVIFAEQLDPPLCGRRDCQIMK
jgi:hypothetical protein